MAVNDIYQVNMVGKVHGQTTINTFHYIETATGAGSAEGTLATALNSGLVAAVKGAASNEWAFEKLVIQQIRPLPPLLAFEDPTAAGAGMQFAESLPSSVAVVVTKRTGLAGRANRGRCYFAGVAATHEVDSKLSTVGLGLWTLVATEMSDNIVSGAFTFDPIVYHRAAGSGTAILSAIARDILRNQRRRQVGKGV